MNLQRGLLAALLFGAASLALGQQGRLNASIVVLDDLVIRPVALTDFYIEAQPGGERSKVRTDTDGRIQADLAPATYRLVSAAPTSLRDHSFSWMKEFQIKAGETTSFTLTQTDATDQEKQAVHRISDEARLYQRYKGSVVTVKGELVKGSGFLVDSLGLILTNYHVVRNSDSLSVVFGPGKRYEAILCSFDPDADIAVLRVSADVVTGLEPLPILALNEQLPIEGEKVVAIGSPLHQEKTLTQGLISKVESDVLISDVNINHGNSGGPVLDMDGKVIGLATFGDLAGGTGGPGISGIVPIRKAAPVVSKAKENLAQTATPSTMPLPEVSSKTIPPSLLDEVANGIKDDARYLKAPRNFRTYIDTPFDAQAAELRFERDSQKKINRRYKNRQQPTSNSQAGSEASPSYYWLRYATSRYDPVVRIRVLPWPQETGGSTWAGIFGAIGGVRTKRQLELRDDFRSMKLYRDGVEVVPIDHGRYRSDYAYEGLDIAINDSAYAGVYIYDPMAFAPDGKIELHIWTNDKEKFESIVLDKQMQAKIWKQFAPWSTIQPSQ